MIELGAFADEISPWLPEAVSVLREHGITMVDLRSVDTVNVLDLDDRQLLSVRHILDDAEMTVGTVASLIGKTSVDTSFADELARFDRAVDIALTLRARFIRIFSYYGPGGGWSSRTVREAHMNEIADRIAKFDRYADQVGLTVVVENDRQTFADAPDRMQSLLLRTGSVTVRTAFDPANYLLCGYTPYPAAYEALRPWVGCVHVKDVDHHKEMTVVGRGLCRWPDIIADVRADPRRISLSLEPHLLYAGPSGGFTGELQFRVAAAALTALVGGDVGNKKGVGL